MSFSLLLADHRFDLDNLGGMSLDRISHHGFVGKWACLMQRVDIIIGEADIAKRNNMNYWVYIEPKDWLRLDKQTPRNASNTISYIHSLFRPRVDKFSLSLASAKAALHIPSHPISAPGNHCLTLRSKTFGPTGLTRYPSLPASCACSRSFGLSWPVTMNTMLLSQPCSFSSARI